LDRAESIKIAINVDENDFGLEHSEVTAAIGKDSNTNNVSALQRGVLNQTFESEKGSTSTFNPRERNLSDSYQRL